MDGKAMPQIMEPGLVTRAVTAAHPGILTQTSEVLFDDLDRHGSAATQDKERRPRTLRVPGCLSLREILRQHLLEVSPIVSGSIFACRWGFQMQAVNMGDHLLFTRPPTEVETQHLIGALGGRPSHPQADQQTRNKGRIHLDAHPVEPLAQQMSAAQDTFDPTEK